jgi:malate dehydrogenase (oxaloacetate-decarboxylating)
MSYDERSLRLHRINKGKLQVNSKFKVRTKELLSMAYTPGVAAVCMEIAKNPDLAYKYTIKGNTVAIVTDGSAVLGLGNIGGTAAIPVMEGKALLMKELAGVDAFPICFEDYHTDFIDDVKNIRPIFGAINLEDIAAPKCFEVEEALQDIGIPVMHDDQHATAIVTIAALFNALKITGLKLSESKIVINGAGAAGIATAKLLIHMAKNNGGVGDIVLCDSKGIIYAGRDNLNKYKENIALKTNYKKTKGNLADAMKGSDVFIGLSRGNLVSKEMVKSMNSNPIIFAMANPTPEIMPEDALEAGAAVVGTGRSDYPNQINNVLAFPGIFRGALDACATAINNEMKVAAAEALAGLVPNPRHDYILPSPLDPKVAMTVAKAVEKAACDSGICKIRNL